jgi:hypothetical protein
MGAPVPPPYTSRVENPMDSSKRAFLQTMAAMAVERATANLEGAQGNRINPLDRRLIIVITGGMRAQETFSRAGQANIPHLSQDLLPHAVFYSNARNEGVTSHFNSISSILTGNWQRVDDWGNQAPSTPTLFEYARRQRRIARDGVWMVASNKALTYRIGASSAGAYGAPFGANVVFPKALLLTAVEEAIQKGHQSSMVDRNRLQREIESIVQGSDYEGLGWDVLGEPRRLDSAFESSVQSAIQSFVHANSPATGDQLTFFVAIEIMRRYAPSLLVVNLSDVEVAHFGSYAMHLAGIRNTDRLIYELWQEVSANPEYRDKTLMVVVPEFGRDPDGSNTNGFFNHRANAETCRRVWMVCLGQHLARPQIIERPVRLVDVCPSLSQWLGCDAPESKGARLEEIVS